MTAADWTHGGDRIVYQRCAACGHTWYFHRDFCPACGDGAPAESVSAGTGTVHAGTLVLRAPSDEFRAIAPYRIVLVDVDEGFRMMGHAEPSLAIGDRVRAEVRTLAGRSLPFFNRNNS
jgi:uncharacterized OB-fold protein